MGWLRPAYGRDAGITVLVCLGLLDACSRAYSGPPAAEPRGYGYASSSPPRPLAADTFGPAPQPATRGEVQRGYASWYGAALAGHRTASGERFDPTKMTGAHRTLPFGTWVEVRRVDGGATVRVRITDRGPFGHDDRIIDLARAAADKLGMLKSGLVLVEVRVVDGP